MSLAKCAVALKGLPGDANIGSIWEMCSEYGAVANVDMEVGDDEQFHGRAVVVFEHEQSVDRVLKNNYFHARALSESQLAQLEINLQNTGEEDKIVAAARTLTPALKKLTPEKRRMALSSLLGMSSASGVEYDTGSVRQSHNSPSPSSTNIQQHPTVWQEAPRIPAFSGLEGKDVSYGKWRYEVMCMMNDKQSTAMVKAAVRKSLKSPAADVLRRLGENASLDQILLKFHSLYGTVLSGDDLLQKFYGEHQRAKETCAEWSCRLEEYMYQAIEQGAATEAIRQALPSRFWSGLRDEKVKNALRNRSLAFDDFVIEGRRVEEEYASQLRPAIRSQQIEPSTTNVTTATGTTVTTPTTSTNEKLDFVLARLAQIETNVAEMKGKPEQQPIPPAQKTQVRCAKCQGIDHLGFACRTGMNLICYKCKAVGHVAAGCLNC